MFRRELVTAQMRKSTQSFLAAKTLATQSWTRDQRIGQIMSQSFERAGTVTKEQADFLLKSNPVLVANGEVIEFKSKEIIIPMAVLTTVPENFDVKKDPIIKLLDEPAFAFKAEKLMMKSSFGDNYMDQIERKTNQAISHNNLTDCLAMGKAVSSWVSEEGGWPIHLQTQTSLPKGEYHFDVYVLSWTDWMVNWMPNDKCVSQIRKLQSSRAQFRVQQGVIVIVAADNSKPEKKSGRDDQQTAVTGVNPETTMGTVGEQVKGSEADLCPLDY